MRTAWVSGTSQTLFRDQPPGGGLIGDEDVDQTAAQGASRLDGSSALVSSVQTCDLLEGQGIPSGVVNLHSRTALPKKREATH